jgi:hypothetical protein
MKAKVIFFPCRGEGSQTEMDKDSFYVYQLCTIYKVVKWFKKGQLW